MGHVFATVIHGSMHFWWNMWLQCSRPASSCNSKLWVQIDHDEVFVFLSLICSPEIEMGCTRFQETTCSCTDNLNCSWALRHSCAAYIRGSCGRVTSCNHLNRSTSSPSPLVISAISTDNSLYWSLSSPPRCSGHCPSISRLPRIQRKVAFCA